MAFFVTVLGIGAGVILVAITLYNTLVQLRNRSENAWSDIDVQLKQRYDLIPNLVETVKGYAKHESGTLEKVIAARSKAIEGGGDTSQRAAAEGGLSKALGGIFALAESYPELKANQNFIALQDDLTKIEDKLQNARRYYNAVVRDLNTRCETFPSVIIANSFGFHKEEYFELDSTDEREAPKVQFGN